MKLLSTLLFLVSFSVHAAQPSGVPSVTMSAAGLNSASMTIVPGQLAANCGGANSSGGCAGATPVFYVDEYYQ